MSCNLHLAKLVVDLTDLMKDEHIYIGEHNKLYYAKMPISANASEENNNKFMLHLQWYM